MPFVENPYIFKRSFTCDGKSLSIGISVPNLDTNGDYICTYEIITTGSTITRKAAGIDAIQAFIMALMQSGSLLYSGRLVDPAKTFWLSSEDMGYLGLPVPIEDQERIPSGPKLILAM